MNVNELFGKKETGKINNEKEKRINVNELFGKKQNVNTNNEKEKRINEINQQTIILKRERLGLENALQQEKEMNLKIEKNQKLKAELEEKMVNENIKKCENKIKDLEEKLSFYKKKLTSLNEEYNNKFLSKEGIQLRKELLEKNEKRKMMEYIKQNLKEVKLIIDSIEKGEKDIDLKEFEEPKIVKKDENDNDTEILENFLG